MSVVGYLYQRGLAHLRQEGRFPSRVMLVHPPLKHIGLGDLRIIAQRETADGLELLLSYEDYR